MKMKKAKQPGRIKSAILEWFGVPASYTGEAASSSNSDQTVTDTSMMQLSAVWACVRLISETIATLPLSMYERTGAGKRVASNHPLQWLIHDMPNSDSTASVFWESTVAAMLLRGNGRIEKRVQNGKVTSLLFLAPNRLSKSVL